MNGATHIWRRLRRWCVLACWRARLRQLDQLIAQLDASIARDASALAALQVEHRLLRVRLAAATCPAPPAPPLTWGL